MMRKDVTKLFLCVLCFVRCAAQDYFANPSKNLFVDDDQIELKEHVTRTLHTPVFSAANPVLPPEKPWEGSVILQPGTVIYDEQEHIFKMWYNSLATRSKHPGVRVLCDFYRWNSLDEAKLRSCRVSRLERQ